MEKKRESGSYASNEKAGKWCTWNEAGQILQEIEYRKRFKKWQLYHIFSGWPKTGTW
jgi:hypothetical protein